MLGYTCAYVHGICESKDRYIDRFILVFDGIHSNIQLTDKYIYTLYIYRLLQCTQQHQG